ncbi:MAG: T9SS type A sorting domain-containing protein [Candidatus Delongbacteria bacterium]|nr:T9SS type A sorting domain-containing protein [Candidatus Delongbacteria bacterium]MBN2835900.1 T9SS type A sorting domain-containing protein [Candidatus Delongbacteria bacterium]
MKNKLFLITLAVFFQFAFADVFYWNGSVSSEWSDLGNWQDSENNPVSISPSTYDEVRFLTAPTNSIILTDNRTVSAIRFGNTNSNHTIHLNGHILTLRPTVLASSNRLALTRLNLDGGNEVASKFVIDLSVVATAYDYVSLYNASTSQGTFINNSRIRIEANPTTAVTSFDVYENFYLNGTETIKLNELDIANLGSNLSLLTYHNYQDGLSSTINNVGSLKIDKVTFNAGRELTLGGLIGLNASVFNAGSYTHNISGTFAPNTINYGTSTLNLINSTITSAYNFTNGVNFSGTSNVSPSLTGTDINVTGGTLTVSTGGVVANNLNISNGASLAISTAGMGIDLAQNLTNNGSIVMPSSTGKLYVAGNITSTGAFTWNSGTLYLDGASNQSISGLISATGNKFNFNVLNSTGSYIDIDNDLHVNNFTHTNGHIRVDNGNKLYVYGTDNIGSSSNITLDNGQIVTDQELDFKGNVALSNNSQINTTNNLVVSGTVIINSGKILMDGDLLSVSGTLTLTGSAEEQYTNANGSDYGNMNISGTLNIADSDLKVGSLTAGASSNISGNVGSSITYYDFNGYTNAGGTVSNVIIEEAVVDVVITTNTTYSVETRITGNLTIQSGTLSVNNGLTVVGKCKIENGGVLSLAAVNVSIGDSLHIKTGGVLTGSSNSGITTGNHLILDGTLNYTTGTGSGNITITSGNLYLNNNMDLESADLNVNNGSIYGASDLIPGAGTVTLTGNFDAGFSEGTSTVKFVGSGNSTIKNGLSFYNLQFLKNSNLNTISTTGLVSFSGTLTSTTGYFVGGLRTTKTGLSYDKPNFVSYTLPSSSTVTITRYSGRTAPGAENAIENYVTISSASSVTPTNLKVYFNKNLEMNGSSQNNLMIWQQVGENSWTKFTNPPVITDGSPFSNWAKSGEMSAWSNTIVKYAAMDNTFTSLPVAFDNESFYANTVINGVELSWITHSEEGLKGFIIYRSVQDDQNFEEIARWTDFPELTTKNEGGFSTNDTEYIFVDELVASGRYYYRVESFCSESDRQYHPKIVYADFITESDNKLFQNFPNPFNATTVINFFIVKNSDVKLSVYNSNGELVEKLVDKNLNFGRHSIVFNSDKLTSGLYFYRLQVDNQIYSKRMVFIK